LSLAGAALSGIQRIVGGLGPGSLGMLGVPTALRSLARRVAQRDGLPVSVQVDDATGRIAEQEAMLLYRVAEHALRNARLHRRATTACIEWSMPDGRARLIVEDDGATSANGLADPLRAEPGLYGLREALVAAGGELRFESEAGRGTRVIATLPIASGTNGDGGAGASGQRLPA
jgi:signal transduction histidine kinase